MNEIKQFIKQITEIKDVCNGWLQDVKSLGNETAYSDSFIDRIIYLSKELEKQQRARGLYMKKQNGKRFTDYYTVTKGWIGE